MKKQTWYLLFILILISYKQSNAQTKTVTSAKEVLGCWSGARANDDSIITVIITSKTISIKQNDKIIKFKFKKVNGEITFLTGNSIAHMILEGDGVLHLNYIKENETRSRAVFMVIPFRKCISDPTVKCLFCPSLVQSWVSLPIIKIPMMRDQFVAFHF